MQQAQKNRKWWTLAAMMCSISMIFIDITVLPVALPTIQASIAVSELAIQWIINAYILALTLFMIAWGKLGDRVGHRKVFLFGLLVFSVGSALCALSYSSWWFIASRFIQGIGGAMLIPNATYLVYHAFPVEQRGKAVGLYVSGGAVFLSLGPLIGGLFSEYLSWRLIFWINPFIAIVGTCLTFYGVQKNHGKKSPFDFVGFVSSFIGICLLVIPIMQAINWGWTSPYTLVPIALGFCTIAFVYFHCRKTSDPYIDVSLFKRKNFLGAVSCISLTQFFIMVSVFWAIYFQEVTAYSPVKAGLLVLCSNLPVIVAAPVGGHLFDKWGPKRVICIGFAIATLACIWFLQIMKTDNMWLFLSALIPIGIGIPFVFTPSFSTAIGEAPLLQRGVVSGMANMLRQLGGTLGLAILGSVYLQVKRTAFIQTGNVNEAMSQGLAAILIIAAIACVIGFFLALWLITKKRLVETENRETPSESDGE